MTPDMHEKPKVVIVTGAGTGIGFEICKQLLINSYTVILNDIADDLTIAAVAKLQDLKGQCKGVAGDAANIETINRLVITAVEDFGRLDAVVANAGITVYGSFLAYQPDELHRILSTNVAGNFFLAQAAAKQMVKQGGGGSILFTSSVTGHQAHSNLVAYGMTKAALEMLAKGLVAELSPYRINVNTVAPGATLTERTQQYPNYEEIWSSVTPMGRPATTGDIAQAVRFLISDDAKHITGQTLVIDGGWTSVSPHPPSDTV